MRKASLVATLSSLAVTTACATSLYVGEGRDGAAFEGLQPVQQTALQGAETGDIYFSISAKYEFKDGTKGRPLGPDACRTKGFKLTDEKTTFVVFLNIDQIWLDNPVDGGNKAAKDIPVFSFSYDDTSGTVCDLTKEKISVTPAIPIDTTKPLHITFKQAYGSSKKVPIADALSFVIKSAGLIAAGPTAGASAVITALSSDTAAALGNATENTIAKRLSFGSTIKGSFDPSIGLSTPNVTAFHLPLIYADGDTTTNVGEIVISITPTPSLTSESIQENGYPKFTSRDYKDIPNITSKSGSKLHDVIDNIKLTLDTVRNSSTSENVILEACQSSFSRFSQFYLSVTDLAFLKWKLLEKSWPRFNQDTEFTPADCVSREKRLFQKLGLKFMSREEIAAKKREDEDEDDKIFDAEFANNIVPIINDLGRGLDSDYLASKHITAKSWLATKVFTDLSVTAGSAVDFTDSPFRNETRETKSIDTLVEYLSPLKRIKFNCFYRYNVQGNTFNVRSLFKDKKLSFIVLDTAIAKTGAGYAVKSIILDAPGDKDTRMWETIKTDGCTSLLEEYKKANE